MQADTFPRLVGDIGGTHARFAWQSAAGSPLGDFDIFPCASYPSLVEAMRCYLEKHSKRAPRWCAIGIANPVLGDHVQMTNHHWSFSIAEIRRQLNLDRFVVINDFTALALALPELRAADLYQVGSGSPAAEAPLGLIGPGTGLGVSGLLPAAGGLGWVPVSGEGGHVTLAASNEMQERVIAILRKRFGHVSAERALSGPGLVNLHGALCELAHEPAPTLSAAQITTHAISGTDARCADAVNLFFMLLGGVAGDLALSLGARGGIYIGGGVVPRLGGLIDSSRFRESFESKGRFRTYLREIPTYVIQSTNSPALLGAARSLDAG